MLLYHFHKWLGSLLLVLLLTACTSIPQATSNEILPTRPSMPTSIPEGILPSYIHTLWPGMDATVTQAKLTGNADPTNISVAPGRGVGISIFGNHVGIPLNEPKEYLMSRSTLFIDGERISNESLLWADGLVGATVTDMDGNYLGERFEGPLYLSWTPSLSVGEHTAKYVLIMDEAQFEYEWSFTVIE